VARGDDDAEGGVQGSGQVGHGWRGNHPEPEHVDARAGQAGHHGGLQELTRHAGVAADDGQRAPGTVTAGAAAAPDGG
jgi:hypothetical protein